MKMVKHAPKKLDMVKSENHCTTKILLWYLTCLIATLNRKVTKPGSDTWAELNGILTKYSVFGIQIFKYNAKIS